MNDFYCHNKLHAIAKSCRPVSKKINYSQKFLLTAVNGRSLLCGALLASSSSKLGKEQQRGANAGELTGVQVGFV